MIALRLVMSLVFLDLYPNRRKMEWAWSSGFERALDVRRLMRHLVGEACM